MYSRALLPPTWHWRKTQHLVKTKQNGGKTDGRQESIFKTLSVECTMPGVRARFTDWCLFLNLGELLDLLQMPGFPTAASASNASVLFHWLGDSLPPWQVMTLSPLFMAVSLLSWTILKYASTQHSCSENLIYCCNASLQ